jgi:glyoxylase-like metal-dependent hydrolase (beta-lactamase superfamily II)
VIVTHGHADHASGAPMIAARYPSTVFRKYPHAGDESRYPVRWISAADGDEIVVGNEVLIVLHTPGHSPDHIALWHPSSRSLFAGDLIIPGGTVMIDASGGGRLEDYLLTLERIRTLQPRRLYPAHGSAVDEVQSVLQGSLDHRHMRERQVIQALGSGPTTVEAIANAIYDDLAPALMPAARETVRAHLQKLNEEGRAVERNGKWSIDTDPQVPGDCGSSIEEP